MLKFISAKFDSTVPEYKGDLHPVDQKFLEGINAKLNEYIELLEKVEIKRGLQICMALSSDCNGYLQETKPFDLIKTD